jgi:chloride channel protein, CIC family
MRGIATWVSSRSIVPTRSSSTTQAAETGLTALVERKYGFLLPSRNVKEALAQFEQSEAEALAVVDKVTDLRVLGVLAEAHALRVPW